VNTFKRSLFDLSLVIFLIALDQVTKAVAISSLMPEIQTPVFSFLGIDLSWTLTTNIGAAWGIFHDLPFLLLLLRLLFITLLIGMYVAISYTQTSIALIISGALSNIFDTFFRGHVVDMIHFRFWGWNYPVFNIADTCICIGIFGIIWNSFFHKGKKRAS
jgi:signal peptidase II